MAALAEAPAAAKAVGAEAPARGTTGATEKLENELAYTFNGSVALASAEQATMVCRALEVDPELNPDQVSRELSTDGRTLHMAFAASELRLLRAAVGTFYDLLALAVRTAERFGGSGNGSSIGAAVADGTGGAQAAGGEGGAEAAAAAVGAAE